MTTDEDLARITIGPVKRLDGPVLLADYDPEWPARYAALEQTIRAALADAVLIVEHVGSTSVPGLAAKPIIDILLVVAEPPDEAAYVDPLREHGFVLRIREPHWYEHRMLKGGDEDVNLHVFGAGCPEIERMLGFRDRLRAYAADRERYEAVKRELAARRWPHVQAYADAKTAVVEEILARA